jgi:para-aminobenzoate synthetase component 1
VEAAIAAVAARSDAAVLDSADTAAGRGRYTLLACEPLEICETWPGGPDPFSILRGRLAGVRNHGDCDRSNSARAPHADRPAFLPGWIGYFAYEAGHHIERIAGAPRLDIRLPVSRWALYDTIAVHDARTGLWSIVSCDLRMNHPHAAAPADRMCFWKELLGSAGTPFIPATTRVTTVRDNMSVAGYLDRVGRAKAYIASGDIFQVNLARRISIACSEPAIRTYLRLRRSNPAAYAAYLAWDHDRCAILSASPELFLDLDGRKVTTRPIKGTRPRSSDPVVDASNRQALLSSEKDRAELAMIVDLERNDLGRVCEYDSIHVRTCPERSDQSLANHPEASFSELESHPTVHHLVATVTGRLRPDCDTIDLLKASFPGGSITGAPKVRAMQIIDELEPTQRSVYTGAIGHIGLNGRMQLNIAIRTILIADGQAHIHVGSGIVADSDPHEEYAETVAKAAGLCSALGIGAPAVRQVL